MSGPVGAGRPALLDANVLIALTITEHEHHERAERWFAGIEDFALCPVTEGALVRFLLRVGEGTGAARTVLQQLQALPACRWWADDISYTGVDMTDLRGHRQVTDAYLAALAAHHGAVLATFDRALHDLRPEQTLLIPDS